MAFHVTQCPGCESTFNTSARILQSATGKVRCGACLMVFEAAENFIDVVDIDEEENSSVFVGNDPSDYFDPSSFFTRSALTAPEDPAEAFGTAAIPGTGSSETVTSELASPPDLPVEHAQNHVEITDNYEHESQEFFTAIAHELDAETETAKPFDTNSVNEKSAPLESVTPLSASPEDIRSHAPFSMHRRPPPAATKPDSLEESKITEALAEPATQEDSAAELSAPQVEIEIIDLDAFDEFVETGGDSFSAVQEITAATANFDDADAIAGFNAVEDTDLAEDSDPVEDSDEVEELFTNSATDSIDQIDDAASDQEAVLKEAIAVDADSTESIRARAFRALLRDDEALEALPLESRSAIGKVLPPVELLAGRERYWGKRVLMALACILLGMTLGGQFLWQQFPVYSRTAQLRPLYEFACRVLSCELPVYSEISAIRSDNLVVRSHQSVEEALTVSLTFRNTAPFPQPFPVLILSFNSASNNIIALREFAPSEYLDTGLQNIALMPVLAPVQVDLDVIDPGADAVNYTVAYRRP